MDTADNSSLIRIIVVTTLGESLWNAYAFIKNSPEFELLAICSSFNLLETVQQGPVDVIVFDSENLNRNEIILIDTILKFYKNIKVILLRGDDVVFEGCKHQKGLIYILNKNCTPLQIKKAIIKIVFREKESFLSHFVPLAKRLKIEIFSEWKPKYSLSLKEKEFLLFLCKDKNAKDLEKAFGLSKRSAQRYVGNIFMKTGAKTHVGLLLYSLKHNLI